MLKDKDVNINDIDKKNQKDEILEYMAGEYGKGEFLRFDQEGSTNVNRWPIKIISLDYLLGGGLPKGIIIEIFGKEGSGKTTLALQMLSNMLEYNPGTRVLFIDAESSANFEFFKKMLYKNKSRAYYTQNNIAEKVFNVIDDVANRKMFDIIVVDSIASLVCETEVKNDIGDVTIAGLARVLSASFKRIVNILSKNNITLILINQLRTKVTTFGLPGGEITCGGNSIKYHSSIRLELTRISLINKNDSPIGARIRFKTLKNKFFFPFREKLIDIHFGKGFESLNDLVDWCIEKCIIKKSGSWYSYLNENIGQGKDAVVELLKNNTELKNELETKIADIILSEQENLIPLEENEEKTNNK